VSTEASTGLIGIANRPAARQFIKFCIVGLSSAAIDFGLLNLLHYQAGLPVAVAATISFFIAVCNGFYWNRRWTFRAEEGDAKKQYPKFVLTNIIGWMLNLLIMTSVLVLAERMGWMQTRRTVGEIIRIILLRDGNTPFAPLALNGAKAIATLFVTAWNFSAAKFWTFK
jgi:putative flippase GtrA